jgi:hypothetical protein
MNGEFFRSLLEEVVKRLNPERDTLHERRAT